MTIHCGRDSIWARRWPGFLAGGHALEKATRILVVPVLLCSVFIGVGWVTRGSAEELSASWLSGTWTGTSPSPIGGEDRRTVIFGPDGKFKGDIESRRGGLVEISGTYKIDGDGLQMDGLYDRGPRGIQGARFTWTLNRKGDDLEGTMYSHATAVTIPLHMKRTK
jgi:hypothetical protein